MMRYPLQLHKPVSIEDLHAHSNIVHTIAQMNTTAKKSTVSSDYAHPPLSPMAVVPLPQWHSVLGTGSSCPAPLPSSTDTRRTVKLYPLPQSPV